MNESVDGAAGTTGVAERTGPTGFNTPAILTAAAKPARSGLGLVEIEIEITGTVSTDRRRPYAGLLATDPADLEPIVTIIADEFSSMNDEAYAAALGAWIAEIDAADPVVVPVSAADSLRELREHGES